MFKPVLVLAAAGFLSVALWKILSVLLLPLAGVLLGFVFTILKLALVVAMVLFVIWLFRRNGEKQAPAD